jgi:cytochrome P450
VAGRRATTVERRVMSVTRLAPPPGPRGPEVLRFFGGGSFARTLAYFEEVARRYGPIASFRVLGRRLHLVTGPALVREVLVVQQHRFTRANGAAILRDLLGESMLTVDEPRHREQRRIVQPAFHAQRVAGYGAAMLEETHAAIDGWRDGDRIDVSAAMTRLALAVVGRSLFGADVRASGSLETSLAHAMRTVSWLGPILEAFPAWANGLRLRLPLPANAGLKRARRAMADVIELLIAARRSAPLTGGADLLSGLLAARDAHGSPLGTQTIADELVTLLLAGHETTANALAWAWYLLARQPENIARLTAEVDAATAGRTLAAEDLPRLTFAGHVFAEALRLFPPASAFGRRALEACEIGGYGIRAGDGILLSPYVSGRNPAVFAAPESFEPDRWAGATPPPFAYFPFGGGSRLCIGEAFARMEGTLVLAAIAQRFTMRAIDERPIAIDAHATLRPERPIVLRAVRRPAAVVFAR